MASTVTERIKVSGLSKFSFKVGEEFINYSQKLLEADKTRVVPGAEFDAELYVADSGKRYLNKILSGVGASVASVPSASPVVDTERAKKFTPKFQKKEEGVSGGSMSKDEWAAKDKRISRQGCIQAAVQALAPVMSTEELFLASKTLADKMLGYVNEVK